MSILEISDGSIKGNKTRFIEELELQHHKKWKEIYKEIGAVQTEPTNFMKENVHLLLKKDARVLDIGCGTGRNTRYIHEKGIEVIGVDKLEEAIKIAKLKAPDIHFEVADAQTLPFPDNSFSGVVCLHVIEHHLPEEIRQIIREIARVVKKGGILLLSTVSVRDSAKGNGKRLCDNTYIGIETFLDGGEIHHFFTRTELINLLGKYFDIIDIHHSTYSNFDQLETEDSSVKIAHWHVVARKR